MSAGTACRWNERNNGVQSFGAEAFWEADPWTLVQALEGLLVGG
jgi:hypothetical protein